MLTLPRYAASFKAMLTLPTALADQHAAFAALWHAQVDDFVQSSVVSRELHRLYVLQCLRRYSVIAHTRHDNTRRMGLLLDCISFTAPTDGPTYRMFVGAQARRSEPNRLNCHPPTLSGFPSPVTWLVGSLARGRYDTNRDMRALQRLALPAVVRLDLATGNTKLRAKDLFEGAVSQILDAKAALLIGLSILELCLVIAMSNLSITHDDARPHTHTHRLFQTVKGPGSFPAGCAWPGRTRAPRVGSWVGPSSGCGRAHP